MRDALFAAASTGCICIFVAGCAGNAGPELAPAGGVVTYNGSPLAGAMVTFVPEKGPIATAVTDLEGKYTLSTGAIRGVAVGPSKVSVRAMTGGSDIPNVQPAHQVDQMATAMREWAENQGKKKQAGPKSLIPEKYASADTSGLSFTVEPGGSNQFNIELKD